MDKYWSYVMKILPSKQCAAESTQLGWMRVPPQECVHSPSSSSLKDACQGHCPGPSATLPPTILVIWPPPSIPPFCIPHLSGKSTSTNEVVRRLTLKYVISRQYLQTKQYNEIDTYLDTSWFTSRGSGRGFGGA